MMEMMMCKLLMCRGGVKAGSLCHGVKEDLRNDNAKGEKRLRSGLLKC
jgi:hypothetical protein